MEKLYRDHFEEELRGLERRLEYDPSCGVEELKGILKSLYDMSGQDWLGRGEVQNISLEASIAAYEQIIFQLNEKNL